MGDGARGVGRGGAGHRAWSLHALQAERMTVAPGARRTCVPRTKVRVGPPSPRGRVARARAGGGGGGGRGPQGHRCDFADGRHAVVARPRWLGPRAAARRRRRGGGVGRRARRIGVLQAGVSGAGNGSSGGVLGMRGSDTRDNGSDRAGDAMATRRGCNGSNGRGACARRSWRSSTCATMCTWPNEWLQRVRQMGPPQPF